METDHLPTLQAILSMKMDCGYWSCIFAARAIAKECGHDLLVCHHKNDKLHRWQVTVRHGTEGEAVLILDTGDSPVSSKMQEIKDWVERVHEYEQLSS